MIGALGFSAPWLLLGLIVLPVLWWLLRTLPPQPVLRRFPAVGLLIGLGDETRQRETTPLWLMMLRMALTALVIVAMAGPVLNPDRQTTPSAPLLIVLDGGWASAQAWDLQIKAAEQALSRADQAGQTAALLVLTAPAPLRFEPPRALEGALAALDPEPFLPRLDTLPELPEGRMQTLWITGGLDWPGRETLTDALAARGPLQIMAALEPIEALLPLGVEEDALILRRTGDGDLPERAVRLEGTTPLGQPAELERAVFAPGLRELRIDIEPERLARLTAARLEGVRGVGGVVLADARLAPPEIGIVETGSRGERVELLDPKHYLNSAAGQLGRVITAPLGILIEANPDAILMAEDVALSTSTRRALEAWMDGGGTLIRFATPGLAERARNEQSLLPVRLRSGGGRALGGALSWDVPRALMPFAADSPFAGLAPRDDIRVTAQVLAEPGPDLANATLAALEDGTPLITAAPRGAGQVVLFHIGANAEWSSLPLSGLFPLMLDRLIRPDALGSDPDALAGSLWQLEREMDGFGILAEPTQLGAPQPGERLATAPTGPELRPGFWRSGERVVVRNLLAEGETLAPARWPGNADLRPLARETPLALKPYLLIAAAGLLLLDTLASAFLARGGRANAAALALALLVVAPEAQAQTPTENDIAAASEVTLAHILTGEARLDRLAREGLEGLGHVLTLRTSVEPGPPRGVDLERDDLSFFPLLYWPISLSQPMPSEQAYDRLKTYLATGGVILFDTRDGDLGGVETAERRQMQALAAPLDVPPLVPMPSDHVLTRAFYLLRDMPGRQSEGVIWVSALGSAEPGGGGIIAGSAASRNDGVSPVIIGGGDWAAAWAAGADLRPLYPMGNSLAAERQREIAYRFGVNLVMYVLTGNYKSDQVHLPALLERLGQ